MQKRAMLCVGIDKFDSKDIAPLLGAANDARAWGGFFEYSLGFDVEVLTHEDLAQGKRVLRCIRELLNPLGEGDVFGVFIATHGKSVSTHAGQDQAFLLPDASVGSLEAGVLGEGLLSLKQLEQETLKKGVCRFFMIDACRSPLKYVEAASKSRGDEVETGFSFQGEAIFRDIALRRRQTPAAEGSPMVIINSCPDHHRAVELPGARHGLFSKAALDVMKNAVKDQRSVTFDDGWLKSVGDLMRDLANKHQLNAVAQMPCRKGDVIRIDLEGAGAVLNPLELEFERCFHLGGVNVEKAEEVLEKMMDGISAINYRKYRERIDANKRPKVVNEPPFAGHAFFESTGPVGLKNQNHGAASAKTRDPFGEYMDVVVFGLLVRFRWVPPGEFLMGAKPKEEGECEDETPQHPVTVSQGFWMAEKACSQALWALAMGVAGGGKFASQFFKKPSADMPIGNVSWDDVVYHFIPAIEKYIPSGWKAALPTEAQWEYACRAGTQTAFFWGDHAVQNMLNCAWEGAQVSWMKKLASGPAALAAHKCNPLGLYQMHGNMREWCQDGPREYSGSAVADPTGPLSSELKCVRGGSWSQPQWACRSAFRGQSQHANRSVDVGFRLVLVQA